MVGRASSTLLLRGGVRDTGQSLPTPFCYNLFVGYSLAAKFLTESSADRAVVGIKIELAHTQAPLSVFQFFSDPHWYVAVVGESQDMKVFSRIARYMVTGQIIPLPEATHDALLARRSTPRPPHP